MIESEFIYYVYLGFFPQVYILIILYFGFALLF